MKIIFFNEPEGKFINLDEVTLIGSVAQLQGLITTIQIAIERHQKQDHVHLRDYSSEWQDGDADVVVVVENINELSRRSSEAD